MIVNKSDVDQDKASVSQNSLRAVMGYGLSVIGISAKNGDGLREVEEELLHLLNFKALEDSNVVVTHALQKMNYNNLFD